MRTNYVPMHSRYHADSEYVSYVEVDRKGAEFTGNKQTYSHPDTQTFIYYSSLFTKYGRQLNRGKKHKIQQQRR